MLIFKFILKLRFPSRTSACGASVLPSLQHILNSIKNFVKRGYVASDLNKKYNLPLSVLVSVIQLGSNY